MKLKKKINSVVLVMALITGLSAAEEAKKWSFSLEGGSVFAGSNTVQVPNPGGTRFSLTDALNVESKLYYRLRLSYLLGERHQLSLLFAPLRLNAKGVINEQIVFDNTTFPVGENVDALYQFNSYRLTYRYLLFNKSKFKLWIGFTAKIRDAEIKLSTNTLTANTTDLGFVPLLNLLIDWIFTENLGLLLEADALAAPGGQGRAEDVALSLYYKLSDNARFRMGYRFVEGGADVEQVYNFAFISYVHAGIQFRF
jgi:hypothetical protein